MKVIHPENIWQSPSPQGYARMSNPTVPAPEPRAFVPIKGPSVQMRDALARIAAYRAVGKSWRPE